MGKQGTKTAVPRLRFPEFCNAAEWEWKTLSHVCDMRAGKFIAASEISERPDERSYPCYGGNGLRGYTAGFTHSGRFPLIGRQGALCGNIQFVEGDFYATEHALVASPKAETDVGWLRYTLDGLNLNRFATGQAQPGLSVDLLNGVSCAVPGSESEQQKIADCLASLDEVIAAQGRKVEALKAHKHGLMQQLFPREGETRPRLRFPEFRDAPEWSESRLGQLVELQSGATPSKANPEFWNGNIPWVSAKDMKQLFLEDSEDHISSAAIESGAKTVPSGSLLILTRGMTLLKDVPICVVRRDMALNQDVKALRPKDGVESMFLAFLLMASKERLLAMVDIAGHGTGKLDTDGLRDFGLAIPQPEEQQRIADCLSSLDTRITAETQQLAALKTHKQGLMQQLFPAPEAAGA